MLKRPINCFINIIYITVLYYYNQKKAAQDKDLRQVKSMGLEQRRMKNLCFQWLKKLRD